jgi:serine/threonine protein kinase
VRKNSGKSDSSGGVPARKNKVNSSDEGDSLCADQNVNRFDQIGTKNSYPEEEFQTFKMLGEGLQAKLYAARSGDDKQVHCLKIFEAFKDEYQLVNAENEFKVSQILKGHPNIVQIDSYSKNSSVTIEGKQQKRDFMTLEYCERGDLYEFLKQYFDLQD